MSKKRTKSQRGGGDDSDIRRQLREQTGMRFDDSWNLDGIEVDLNDVWRVEVEPVHRQGDERALRELLLPRAALPELPPGTIVRAPEAPGEPAREWRVVRALTGRQEVTFKMRTPEGESVDVSGRWEALDFPPPPPSAYMPMLAGAAMERVTTAEKHSRDSSTGGRKSSRKLPDLQEAVNALVAKNPRASVADLWKLIPESRYADTGADIFIYRDGDKVVLVKVDEYTGNREEAARTRRTFGDYVSRARSDG